MNKKISVAFVDKKLKNSFDLLKKGKFEDLALYKDLEKCFDELKENPFCGKKIPKKLWPKTYIKNYKINNLWKYDFFWI